MECYNDDDSLIFVVVPQWGRCLQICPEYLEEIEYMWGRKEIKRKDMGKHHPGFLSAMDGCVQFEIRLSLACRQHRVSQPSGQHWDGNVTACSIIEVISDKPSRHGCGIYSLGNILSECGMNNDYFRKAHGFVHVPAFIWIHHPYVTFTISLQQFIDSLWPMWKKSWAVRV